MKNYIFCIIKNSVMLLIFVLLAACSAGGGSSNQGSGTTTADQGTGSIAVKLDWGTSNKTTSKTVASAPAGVVKMQVNVTGPGITPTIQKEFFADVGTGTIEGVIAGTRRTLTVLGLNASGTVTHHGIVENIIVQPGKTTDAGIIIMSNVATLTINTDSEIGSLTKTGFSTTPGVITDQHQDTIWADPSFQLQTSFGGYLRLSVTGTLTQSQKNNIISTIQHCKSVNRQIILLLDLKTISPDQVASSLGFIQNYFNDNTIVWFELGNETWNPDNVFWTIPEYIPTKASC